MRARVTFLLGFLNPMIPRGGMQMEILRIYIDFDDEEEDWERNLQNGRIAFGGGVVEWNEVREGLEGLKKKLIEEVRASDR